MNREEIIRAIKVVRKSLKNIEEKSDIPSIERYAHMADIYCSLLENHIDEDKELWN